MTADNEKGFNWKSIKYETELVKVGWMDVRTVISKAYNLKKSQKSIVKKYVWKGEILPKGLFKEAVKRLLGFQFWLTHQQK